MEPSHIVPGDTVRMSQFRENNKPCICNGVPKMWHDLPLIDDDMEETVRDTLATVATDQGTQTGFMPRVQVNPTKGGSVKFSDDNSPRVRRSEVSMSRTPGNSAESRWNLSTFDHFCETTSLHGWKFLGQSQPSRKLLRFGWMGVVLGSIGVSIFFLSNSMMDFKSSTVQTTQDTSRGSLQKVFFPSVTLCNINQGRSSLFREVGLSQNETLLRAVLKQAYFGANKPLKPDLLRAVKAIFSSKDVLKKGILGDLMCESTPYRQKAFNERDLIQWESFANETYISEAGWYFKTLAVQEMGENFVLSASYRRIAKDTQRFTSLLPFFGTDYGLCTLIKPQITFNRDLEQIPFALLMKNFTPTIQPGIQLGKENGLSILLDTEVYDYGFSPQRGEGFKLAIHHHMDQPIMALSDVDISPGFVTQLSVTPTLTLTTNEARERFTPTERKCYFDDEFRFKYLPQELYRYGLSNCLFSATYHKIIQTCQCVPFFHTLAYDDYPAICAGTSLLCMNSILMDIGSHTHAEDSQGVSRPCYSSCQDQTNKMAVTTSVFPNQNTFTLGPEFCILYQKLLSTCRTKKNVTLEERYPNICSLVFRNESRLCVKGQASWYMDGQNPADGDEYVLETQQTTLLKDQALMSAMYAYARENLALVNVYIKDPAVTQIKRDQRIPVIWFIANVGGILGLTMGCSLVTVFEILHHMFLIFFRTGRKSLKRVNQSLLKPR
ncbi:hypothetical protein TCAL_05309 [Tigriopus californicus]|uniref:Uncharacterized protein n=1 Tax=Tigriopus californicus TaxID=6832 RepID=A0A553PFV3_TIGCA|nr:hypothetical protein TCAL_05309 [Tigriopus californicus]